ncbi:hypothetical protein BJ508DRAFT_328872 [Ascobolus immersus RN42]|uniref:F-box domain-containing protein n=1 Tax=Ascobolus immersus RN42 TaxID=1160509 RepID=A0A3N4HYC6_ASCIM|nr:hypothetical protein BJ508DRAFT_328872 [Ascobolus immersus RN42]
MRQIQGQSVSPPSSLLLSLPTELRLAIYQECSAFALVQLTYVSTKLRSEILDSPMIFTQAYGYGESPLMQNPDFPWDYEIPRINKRHPSQLSMFNIERVASHEERRLVNRIYRLKKQNGSSFFTGWWGCGLCLRVEGWSAGAGYYPRYDPTGLICALERGGRCWAVFDKDEEEEEDSLYT